MRLLLGVDLRQRIGSILKFVVSLVCGKLLHK